MSGCGIRIVNVNCLRLSVRRDPGCHGRPCGLHRGHSYERAAITRDTSPCTNALLLHKNVVPNHALRNLIVEVRGVRRPITLEEHVAAATPCCPEELDDTQDSTCPRPRPPRCATCPSLRRWSC